MMITQTALLATALLVSGTATAKPVQPETPPAGAVASAHPLATEAGLQVLRAGGNAFDAAVAVSASLAVVEPYGSGLGGGGFWLLHRGADGFETMVDGREKAPLAATSTMYLDSDGEPDANLSRNGALAAGIPGTPAALVHIAKSYGSLPLAALLQPAIDQASNGFAVSAELLRHLKRRMPVMKNFPAASAIFLDDSALPDVGFVLRQPDLANTLRQLAAEGQRGFYQGEVASQLVDGVRAAGGIWSLEDLSSYQVVERPPLVGHFGSARIVSAPPPSSGGVAIIETLNVLKQLGWQQQGAADRRHLLVEAWRRAYRDRAEHLGDPDFHPVPVERLLNPAYAAGLAASIRNDRATASATLPGVEPAPRGQNTTHFSVMDNAGNYVAATMSINFLFGSGFVPAGTGVLLNNEMDDFSAKPGHPNAYGLVGGNANAIEPGKRMLSSMTPTFVQDERGVAVIGTPGGSRIITMVQLALLNYLDGGSAASMVALPRYHHQFLPDIVGYEQDGLNAAAVSDLENRGHKTHELSRRYGNMQVIVWNKQRGVVEAASDPRGIGAAQVFANTAP